MTSTSNPFSIAVSTPRRWTPLNAFSPSSPRSPTSPTTARRRQNEALLSINCFQKDLSDTNPVVCAWALRTMAGIRLHAVAPLVLAAISKCARDPSSYVRRCAAYALPKLYDLHHDEDSAALEELVDILLSDHSPGVFGAAAVAFKSVCPSRLYLIAKSFRRLCETLPDVEEWSQIVLIKILLRYVIARHGIVKESIMFTSNSVLTSQENENFAAFGGVSNNHCCSLAGMACDSSISSMCKCYIEGQRDCLTQAGRMKGDNNLDLPLTSSTNDDVDILLQCTSPFLWSHNSAVVFGAATVHWIMAPREEVERIIKAVLFILRSFQASKYVVLCNTLVFAKAAPQIFSPYYEEFFVCSSDSYQTRALKLEILSTIATESSVPIILEEFEVLLCAHGEDLLTFRKILSYIIELSKYDLNYDVRDRACFILKLMSHNLTLSSEEAITSFALQNGGIHHEFAEKIFSGKIHSGIAKSLRIYLPGSLSQIVFHAAPGYEPLPQPRSLHAKNINLCTEFGYETKQPDLKMDKSNSFGTDDPDISSGSLFEECGSVYDFHHYFIKSDGLAELISKSSLESWLDERPGLTSTQMPQQPSGRISINNLNCTVTPKLHMLLDPTNSNGLRADYAFSYEISTVSPVLVLIEVFFFRTALLNH